MLTCADLQSMLVDPDSKGEEVEVDDEEPLETEGESTGLEAMFAQVRIGVCACACVCVSEHALVCVCLCVCAYVCMHLYVRACVRACAHLSCVFAQLLHFKNCTTDYRSLVHGHHTTLEQSDVPHVCKAQLEQLLQ